jgi:hypothetical protein
VKPTSNTLSTSSGGSDSELSSSSSEGFDTDWSKKQESVVPSTVSLCDTDDNDVSHGRSQHKLTIAKGFTDFKACFSTRLTDGLRWTLDHCCIDDGLRRLLIMCCGADRLARCEAKKGEVRLNRCGMQVVPWQRRARCQQ